MIITLKRAGTCRECGAALPIGTRANWYRNGAVYGLDCHARSGKHITTSRRQAYQGEDYCCSDAGYEEQCERAYERANGRW